MPCEDVEQFIDNRITVTSLDGQTREVPAGKNGRMISGFEGSVAFGVMNPEKKDHDMLRALSVLTSLAEFCGTGAHTMWGMGLTRIIKGDAIR